MMRYDAIIATNEILMQSYKKFKPNSAAGTLGITIYLSTQMHSAIL